MRDVSLAIGFGFIGMLIIIRPGFQEINMGMLLVLEEMVIQTGNTIIVKLLTQTDSPNTIAFYHSLVMIPVAIVPALIVWIIPTLEQWCSLIALGATGLLTQRGQSRAVAVADASYVLALAFRRLPITALICFLIFDEVPEMWVWIGSAAICASSIYIGRSEANITKRQG